MGAARRRFLIAWLAQYDLLARNRAVPRGDGRCRDNWRQSTLTALNALSGPASAQLGNLRSKVFEGVDRLLLVWLNVELREVRRSLGALLILSLCALYCSEGACPSKTPQSKEWSRRKLRRDLWGERLARGEHI